MLCLIECPFFLILCDLLRDFFSDFCPILLSDFLSDFFLSENYEDEMNQVNHVTYENRSPYPGATSFHNRPISQRFYGLVYF